MPRLPMMPKGNNPDLKNRYVFICAGSNQADPLKICSNTEARLNGNGLSEEGKVQVKKTAERLRATYKNIAQDLILVSSDLKDASETTAILEADLDTKVAAKTSSLLRERSYGAFENESVESLVPLLFAKDQKDPASNTNGAESVIEVITRTGKLFAELEREHNEAMVVIIAHPGVLQILQTMFIGTTPNHFRQISALAPGDMREMPHSAAQATLPRNPRQYLGQRPSVDQLFQKPPP